MEINTQENRFKPEVGVIPTLSPLDISIEDSRLLTYINNLETASKTHWESPEINLTARRKQMVKYLFGRQLIGRDLKKYDSEFLDNVIYEFEGMLKALAVSKMPDIIIEAGGVGNFPERKQTAELLTKFFEKYTNSDITKQDLGMMFKHMPALLIAAKKYRWDATKNKKGDVVEDVIYPEHLLLDHTAVTSNPDEMIYIIHYVEKTAKEWVMLFPNKEAEIKEQVKKANPKIPGDTTEDVLLAQKIRVAEAWYDWLEKASDFDAKENPRFDFTSGVCWKLSDEVLLGKSKNPNWDYEGHDVAMYNGQPVPTDVLEQIVMSGQQPAGFEIKKVFNNYFEFPRKPFIFMTFDQFLRSAIDETSRIEQIIPLQKSNDDVERQTDYMVKNHKGKHIWGSDSGITKKELKKMDMNNPDTDAVVKGNPRDVHEYIQPEMPPAEMFIHIRDRRDRMFAKAGVHGATRGEVTTQVATTNQIAREGDFTKNDDLVNDTILHVATESIRARLHMMKLRYTEAHWKEVAGIEEGKYLSLRLTNDSLDDGMEVIVKASTTDKLRAERNAQSMAGLGYSEPYYYMKDLGIPNAEDRAEAIYLYANNPEMWLEKVVRGKNVSQIADQVTAQNPTLEGSQVNQQTQAPIEGQVVPQEPQLPSPTDTTQIATQPQGGIRGLMGQASQALGKVFGR